MFPLFPNDLLAALPRSLSLGLTVASLIAVTPPLALATPGDDQRQILRACNAWARATPLSTGTIECMTEERENQTLLLRLRPEAFSERSTSIIQLRGLTTANIDSRLRQSEPVLRLASNAYRSRALRRNGSLDAMLTLNNQGISSSGVSGGTSVSAGSSTFLTVWTQLPALRVRENRDNLFRDGSESRWVQIRLSHDQTLQTDSPERVGAGIVRASASIFQVSSVAQNADGRSHTIGELGTLSTAIRVAPNAPAEQGTLANLDLTVLGTSMSVFSGGTTSPIRAYLMGTARLGMRIINQNRAQIGLNSELSLRAGLLILGQFFVEGQGGLRMTGAGRTNHEGFDANVAAGGSVGWAPNRHFLFQAGANYTPEGLAGDRLFETAPEGWSGNASIGVNY
jgi:hypothetical protein